MSDNSQLKQKLDVISYVVAGILSLVLLAIPSFVSSSASETEASVKSQLKKLKKKVKDANTTPIEETPQWSSELRAMWTVNSSVEKASWITENKPASLRLWNDVPAPVAVHEPGGVVSIELVRDGETKSSSLRVTGKLSSKNQHVEIEKIILERKAGEEEFKAIEGFEEVNDFVYEDADIQPGKIYSYRFSTVAVPGQVQEGLPAPILAATAASRSSNELATEFAVPMDLVIKVSRYVYVDERIEPKLLGQITYWDYVKGAKVTMKSRTPEEAWGKGDTFGGAHEGKSRFGIRRIVPEKESKYHGVTIDDHLTGKRLVFKKESKALPSIESWDTVEAAFEVPDKPEETEEPKKTAPSRSSKKPAVKKPVAKPVSAENKKASGSKAKPTRETPKKSPSGRKRTKFE